MKTNLVIIPQLVLKHDRYGADLYKKDKVGRLRKIATIGNYGIAFEFIYILKRLGISVELIDVDSGEDT